MISCISSGNRGLTRILWCSVPHWGSDVRVSINCKQQTSLSLSLTSSRSTGGPVSAYLLPGMRLDLRELELGVVRVHLPDLLPGRRAQHLYDLHQLVHAGIAREDGLAQQQLRQDAAGAPHVYLGRVVDSPEDQLRRPGQKRGKN